MYTGLHDSLRTVKLSGMLHTLDARLAQAHATRRDSERDATVIAVSDPAAVPSPADVGVS
jgi:hypothetical protein